VESIIQAPGVQELVREWEHIGRRQGARALLLKVLAARSFPVTLAVRACIAGESNLARLESWLVAAVTAGTIGDVFRKSQPQSTKSAALLDIDATRRIFHVESIMRDPNVQELVGEWEDKGRALGRLEGRVEGRIEGRMEGRIEGRMEGRIEARLESARSLLDKVLAARSFSVTPDIRVRIDREPDAARLEAWLEAAVTAATIGYG